MKFIIVEIVSAKHNLPSKMKFISVEQLSAATEMYNHSIKRNILSNRGSLYFAPEVRMRLAGEGGHMRQHSHLLKIL